MFYQCYVGTLTLNNGLLKYSAVFSAQESMINAFLDEVNTEL